MKHAFARSSASIWPDAALRHATRAYRRVDGDPGDLLGLFLIAGTLAAGLGVRADALHLIIPVPTLVYLAAGLIAGLIHDRAADTSHTALLVHALQWIAGGFLAITAATLLAVGLLVGRRLRERSPAGTRRSPEVGRRDGSRRDVSRRDVSRRPDSRRYDGRPYDGPRPEARRYEDPRDREWQYLYDRNPDDRTDSSPRPPRGYQ